MTFFLSIISCRADLSKIASSSAQDLLLRIFTRNVSERWTISQILQHNWMIEGNHQASSDSVSGGLDPTRQAPCQVLLVDGGSSSSPSDSSSRQGSTSIPVELVEEIEDECAPSKRVKTREHGEQQRVDEAAKNE